MFFSTFNKDNIKANARYDDSASSGFDSHPESREHYRSMNYIFVATFGPGHCSQVLEVHVPARFDGLSSSTLSTITITVAIIVIITTTTLIINISTIIMNKAPCPPRRQAIQAMMGREVETPL